MTDNRVLRRPKRFETVRLRRRENRRCDRLLFRFRRGVGARRIERRLVGVGVESRLAGPAGEFCASDLVLLGGSGEST